MFSLSTFLSNLVHLFYPYLCPGCSSDVLSSQEVLCMKCDMDLPFTGFQNIKNNPVENLFRGRVEIEAAHSEFYFTKGQLMQRLIHQLKYLGNKEIGVHLGQIMGKDLLKSQRFNDVDFVIPVPLFPEKERKRGYNQAKIICDGLSQVMNIPLELGNLVRHRYTETQTKKHRMERWENVDGSFSVLEPEKFKNKKVLLVDDVLTTGASLEAAALPFRSVEGIRISIATIAFASI